MMLGCKGGLVSLYLDDVVSQSTQFILRNLVQYVITFLNTPLRKKPREIAHFFVAC